MKVSQIMKYSGVLVCARCSEDRDEEAELRTLIRQTRALEQLMGETGKTGLYFLEEFMASDQLCGVFSLRQKLKRKLYPEERRELINELTKSL